jgi:hypothetical protein
VDSEFAVHNVRLAVGHDGAGESTDKNAHRPTTMTKQGSEDEAGRRSGSHNLPRLVPHISLSERNPPPRPNNPPMRGEPTISPNRPQIRNLDLSRRVPDPGSQCGMHSTPGSGVEQRTHQPTMHEPNGVVGRLVRLTREHHVTHPDRHRMERHQPGDGRRRQLPRNNRIEIVQPGHPSPDSSSCHRVMPGHGLASRRTPCISHESESNKRTQSLSQKQEPTRAQARTP